MCAGKSKCDWDTVVKAYKESKINLDLHLIGGKEEQFENISGVVQILYLPINDFIVQGAEFCVLPLEPVPFSFGQMRLLQQMALRKCVIVSDAPSILDYVENNQTAIVYESSNDEELKKQMSYLCYDLKKREAIESAAYEFVKQDCNEKNMAEKIEDFFETVLK